MKVTATGKFIGLGSFQRILGSDFTFNQNNAPFSPLRDEENARMSENVFNQTAANFKKSYEESPSKKITPIGDESKKIDLIGQKLTFCIKKSK